MYFVVALVSERSLLVNIHYLYEKNEISYYARDLFGYVCNFIHASNKRRTCEVETTADFSKNRYKMMHRISLLNVWQRIAKM